LVEELPALHDGLDERREAMAAAGQAGPHLATVASSEGMRVRPSA
jgi:hypothetical protein